MIAPHRLLTTRLADEALAGRGVETRVPPDVPNCDLKRSLSVGHESTRVEGPGEEACPPLPFVTQLCLRGNEVVTSLPEDHQRKKRWSEQETSPLHPVRPVMQSAPEPTVKAPEAKHLNPEIPNRMGSQETEGGRP